MIPKLIHRIWVGDPMPEEFRTYGEQIRALHPGWQMIDWTDPDTLPELRHQDLYDRAEDIMPRDWKRFRSDLLRLELLHRFGGLYLDTDVEVHRPLDPLLENRVCVAGYSPQNTGGRHPITNAVIAAAPEHPWILACLDALPDAVIKYAGRTLPQVAGPWNLTRVYDQGDWPDVTILGPAELYGPNWLTHHWANQRDNRKGGLVE